MGSFQLMLRGFLTEGDELSALTDVLNHQATEQPLGSIGMDTTNEWSEQKNKLLALFEDKTEESLGRALRLIARIVDTLELYSPQLKGLQDVQAFATECLENLIFDQKVSDTHIATAGYLYGQAMAMSAATSEAIATAIENILVRGDAAAANVSLCVLLGVEQSNSPLFETNLPILLRQIQIAAFSGMNRTVSREALLSAMRVYSPTDKASSCQSILQSVHALFAASLRLSEMEHTLCDGVIWACFIIQHTPMLLRLDLGRQYSQICNAVEIFRILAQAFSRCNSEAQKALCGALPILATWSTTALTQGNQVRLMVDFMLDLPVELRSEAMDGLGQLASVVLDRFEPYMQTVGPMVLKVIKESSSPKETAAAQRLLTKLLASLGPMTLSTIVDYLHCPAAILLSDVDLLEKIATLLPNLAKRIFQTMNEIIDDLINGKPCAYDHATVLEALNVFPLDDPELAGKAQRLVLWSLEEEKGKPAVMAALSLAANPFIAQPSIMRSLTYKSAQLLLADDVHIVHLALSVLSNPALAMMLNERSCSMILLALHQSLETSIQIVAAKLLTHLTTAHRAIVQPLAWSHIRQSLALMDFLNSVDPTRAIIEACIISNLLPALPASLHIKYVGPVKTLILSGLQSNNTSHTTLSLIFQGLANLAKFEGWGSVQQSELAMDLLEMTQEIPKDSQHAALNAISRLLSMPTEGLDVYDLLIRVHAMFGGKGTKLDGDLKSLVSGIYGHLGTVERNPVISRDSKAAINRETSVYTPKTILLSQVAEIRDKHGADSQTHINWLVTKNLIGAWTSGHKASEEKSLVLEVMTCLGILQPSAIPGLIPDLPPLIFRELKIAMDTKETHKETTTPIAASILFLASALHTSPIWLSQYWSDTAEFMAEAVREGEVLPVLRGLDVVLDAVMV